VQRNEDFIQSAMNAAATRTYRMAVSVGLSAADREDLQQELMLDLLEHEKRFDPTKGSAGTFTGVVSKNRSIELLDQLMKDRKRLAFFGQDAANDESMGDDPDPYDSNVVPMWADDRDLFADSMALRDLETAMDFMNDEQIVLFDILKANDDLPSACKSSGMSSATFYRRVQDLQMHLRMFGLRSAA
jgi:DNA-directed RNA polymerase specialized sigma24 family protein